jgi:hypothetical protein
MDVPKSDVSSSERVVSAGRRGYVPREEVNPVNAVEDSVVHYAVWIAGVLFLISPVYWWLPNVPDKQPNTEQLSPTLKKSAADGTRDVERKPCPASGCDHPDDGGRLQPAGGRHIAVG